MQRLPATQAALDQAHAAVRNVTESPEWEMVSTHAPNLAMRVILASFAETLTQNLDDPIGANIAVGALVAEWMRHLGGPQ